MAQGLLFLLHIKKIFHGFQLSDELLPALIGTHYLAKNCCCTVYLAKKWCYSVIIMLGFNKKLNLPSFLICSIFKE